MNTEQGKHGPLETLNNISKRVNEVMGVTGLALMYLAPPAAVLGGTMALLGGFGRTMDTAVDNAVLKPLASRKKLGKNAFTLAT